MGKLHVLNHPLIKHKLSMMRKKETTTRDFRSLADEISELMAYEVTRDLPLQTCEIETPICKMNASFVSGRSIGIIDILPSGYGMLNGFLTLVPNAKVGHIGLRRDDEFNKLSAYYCKLPVDVQERSVIVVDPMLATGESAVTVLDFLKAKGCKEVKLMNLIAAPEGVKAVMDAHPDVDIYVAALDEGLNEKNQIVPGLGDASDRLFGTK